MENIQRELTPDEKKRAEILFRTQEIDKARIQRAEWLLQIEKEIASYREYTKAIPYENPMYVPQGKEPMVYIVGDILQEAKERVMARAKREVDETYREFVFLIRKGEMLAPKTPKEVYDYCESKERDAFTRVIKQKYPEVAFVAEPVKITKQQGMVASQEQHQRQ